MSSSMIATIYLIALVVFFILLVVLTIAWIVSKTRKDDEYDEEYGGEYEDIFSEADDTAFPVDSAFSDSEITDETYVNTFDEELAADDTDNEDDGIDNKEPQNTDTQIEADKLENTDTVAGAENIQTVETGTEAVAGENTDTEPEEVSEESTDTEPEAVTDENTDAEPEAVADENTDAEPEEVAEESADTEPEEASEESVDTEPETLIDSAFAPEPVDTGLTNEELNKSVREAMALGEAAAGIGTGFSAAPLFGVGEALDGGSRKHRKTSSVPSTDDFFWFNKMDVAERPSYKTPEMYYHYFDTAKDCIEDLLIEMYDCALVRTEEIRYIAYGIEPRAISMREILSSGNYANRQKLKEPTTQDLVRIYEKWCGYVDRLFDKVEIHADEYTINEIRRILCEYGRSDVDVLLEGK